MSLDQPQNPYLSSFQKTPEQAQIEARAKVFWGDAADDVIKYLQMQGISYDEACVMVDEMFSERERVIRARGVRKIGIGVVLMLVPVVVYLILASIGYIDFKLLAMAVVVGLAGAWFCLKGTFMVVSPSTEIGEVSDQ
jgi:hypothetical protein